MKDQNSIQLKKIFIALLLVGATHIALGSFTGSTNKRTNDLYSLKNFNRNFYKSFSPISLRAGFAYKGTQLLGQKRDLNGDISYNSMMRFEKGNTTYIYPYSHKVSVSRFKTPTPPTLR